MSRAKSKRRRPFAPVDRDAFRESRLTGRLSLADAATFLHVTTRTIRYWESGRTRIPYAAFRLLRIHVGGAVQAKGWEQWWFSPDGRLWSPEGREFRPELLAYWWLLVAEANAWRHATANAWREPRTPCMRFARHTAREAALVGRNEVQA